MCFIPVCSKGGYVIQEFFVFLDVKTEEKRNKMLIKLFAWLSWTMSLRDNFVERCLFLWIYMANGTTNKLNS